MAHIHVYAEFVLLENFAESDFSFIIIVLLKKNHTSTFWKDFKTCVYMTQWVTSFAFKFQAKIWCLIFIYSIQEI